MKLLIVEGNNQATRVERGNYGIKPYFDLFTRLVKKIKPEAQISCVFPADGTERLPTREQIKSFDGVLWTGSSLSVLDNIPDVTQQLNFAEQVFHSGVPFYGSCWGLQVATKVAGGTIVKGKNGLELGISKPIELTKEGKNSPLFSGRGKKFHALCIHYDEVGKLPDNSIILASNSHSKVQAMAFQYKKSNFFGVQYHPEFTPHNIAKISSFLEKKLIKSGYFPNQNYAQIFIKKLTNKKKLPDEIVNYQIHYQEIHNWINSLNSISKYSNQVK